MDDRATGQTGDTSNFTDRSLIYWYSIAAGPFVWALHASVSYMMVGLACDWGTGLPIYLATAVALSAIGLAGYYSYGMWQRIHELPERERPASWGRDNLLLTSALVMAVIFGALVIGSTVQVVFWSACVH